MAAPKFVGPVVSTKAEFKNLFPCARYSGSERTFFITQKERNKMRSMGMKLQGPFSVTVQ